MTTALLGYSSIFMRYSMMVTPKNYLLFGMHFVNFGAQGTQMFRFYNYWYGGGQAAQAEQKAKEGLGKAEGAMKDTANQAEDGAKSLLNQAKEQVNKVTK